MTYRYPFTTPQNAPSTSSFIPEYDAPRGEMKLADGAYEIWGEAA